LAFEVAMFECFGFSIDVFPGVSQSYSAIVVLEFEETASSTSTISLSTSTIKAKTEQLQYRWLQAKRLFVLRFRFHVTPIRSVGSTNISVKPSKPTTQIASLTHGGASK
jgi:hypothetical protein